MRSRDTERTRCQNPPPSTLRQQESSSPSKGTSQGTSHYTPSTAMLRCKNKTQQKLKRNNSASTSGGKRKSEKTEPKGKTYRSRTERKVVDRRVPQQVVQRNKECDTKKGGRNTQTAYSFRNYSRVGSDVFKTGRSDRIYNADSSGESYSQFVAENFDCG